MIQFFQKVSRILAGEKQSAEQSFVQMMKKKHRHLHSAESICWKAKILGTSPEMQYQSSSRCVDDSVVICIEDRYFFAKNAHGYFQWELGKKPEQLKDGMNLECFAGLGVGPDDLLHTGREIENYEIKFLGEEENTQGFFSKFVLYPANTTANLWTKIIGYVDLKAQILNKVEFYNSNLEMKRSMRVLSMQSIWGEDFAKELEFTNGKETTVLVIEPIPNTQSSLPDPSMLNFDGVLKSTKINWLNEQP